MTTYPEEHEMTTAMDFGPTYPSEGARVFATTGRTVSQTVIDEAGIPDEDLASVGLYANYIMNTSPGYRPSDAARYAVRVYKAQGRAGMLVR